MIALAKEFVVWQGSCVWLDRKYWISQDKRILVQMHENIGCQFPVRDHANKFVIWQDTFILHTPGGGGWGLPKGSHQEPNGDLHNAAEPGVEEAGPSPVKKSRREPKIEPEAIASPKTKKNAKKAEETSPSQEAEERRRSLRKRSWRFRNSTFNEIVMQSYSIFSFSSFRLVLVSANLLWFQCWFIINIAFRCIVLDLHMRTRTPFVQIADMCMIPSVCSGDGNVTENVPTS